MINEFESEKLKEIQSLVDIDETIKAFIAESAKTESTLYANDVKSLLKYGMMLEFQGNYSEAILTYVKAIDIQRTSGDINMPISMTILASILDDRQEFERSLPLFERSLLFYESLESPNVMCTLQVLYQIMSKSRSHSEENLYERSFVLIKKCMDKNKDSKRYISTLNILAMSLEKNAKYQEAYMMYKIFISICQKFYGKNHMKTAVAYNNTGQMLKQLGEYKEAKRFCKQALDIFIQVNNGNIYHSTIALAYNNLALINQYMSNYSDALEQHQKVLHIQLYLDKNHPGLLNTLNNIAMILNDTNNYEKAEIVFKGVLALELKNWGENDTSTAMTYNNLALLYDRLNRYGHAYLLYEKAFKIMEKINGAEHHLVGQVGNNMALCMTKMGEFSKALPLYKRSIAILEKTLGPEHLITINALNNLGGLHEAIENSNDALELYKQAFFIASGTLGLNHKLTQTFQNNFTNLYVKINSLPKGEYAY